jgi:hypothetical protein
VPHSVSLRSLTQPHSFSRPRQDARTYYPSLYVDVAALQGQSSLMEVCQILNIELERAGYSAFCPGTHAVAPTAFFQLSAEATATATPVARSVFRYQIVLWLCIILVRDDRPRHRRRCRVC